MKPLLILKLGAPKADIIARLVRYPYEVPVSTVFGIIGAVLFFYLLLKPVRHAD